VARKKREYKEKDNKGKKKYLKEKQ